jgi:hypothetical protein
MAFLAHKNNSRSLTTDNPLAAGATTVNVTAATGARFPAAGDFMLTIWDAVTYPDPSDDTNMEVVRATARSTDAITITRAQEGTTGVAHAQGSKIAMLITAGTIDEHLDQNVKTTDSPTFGHLHLNDDTNQIVLNADGGVAALTLTGASATSAKTITFPNFTGTVYVSSGTDVPVTDGGTGLSTFAAGSVLGVNTLNVIAAINSTSGLKLLRNNAGTVEWDTVTGSAGSPVYSVSPTLTTPVLGAATYTTLTGGNVIPTADSTSDLGASTPKYWANAYLDKVLLNSTATLDGSGAGVIQTVGNIVPSADSTNNLGSSAPKYFANAYIDTVLLNSTATLGGGTAGVVTVTGALTTTLDIGLVAAKKIYLDGVARTGDTYIFESSADIFDLYVGGTNTIKSSSSLITLGARLSSTNGMPDYIVFPVQQAKVGHLTAPATIDGSLNRWYLVFDPDTDWSADFQFIMPFTYAAQTLTVKLMWVSTVASNNVVWNASLMAMTSGDAALLETDSFDTVNATTTAASGTAGRPVTTSITMTNKDSVAAGDIVTLRISRDANNAADTNTGNAKVAGIIIEWN